MRPRTRRKNVEDAITEGSFCQSPPMAKGRPSATMASAKVSSMRSLSSSEPVMR